MIPNGVYPTMITFFKEDNSLDFESMARLIDYYIESGVDGIFAVCQSSEMFFLTLEERTKLARFVVDYVAGRVAVVASGHISDNLEDQANELNEMVKTGIDAVVWVSNRLCNEDENEDKWIENAQRLIDLTDKNIPLGVYECPYPYKRLMSEKIIQWCIESKRFSFLKDTSCDMDVIKKRIEMTKGTGFKLYNANTATLLASLKAGASGFSGVMGNFHPEKYVQLMKTNDERLQDFLSLCSLIELRTYPISAKYFTQLMGMGNSLKTRSKSITDFTSSNMIEVEAVYNLDQNWL